jgi:hypothetical protein
VTGSMMVKVVPVPGSDWMPMVPSAWVTIPYAVARPSPVPPSWPLVVKNGSKTWLTKSAGMPVPVSPHPVVEVQHPRSDDLLTGEGERLVGQLSGGFGGLLDLPDVALHRHALLPHGCRRELLGDEGGVVEDHREHHARHIAGGVDDRRRVSDAATTRLPLPIHAVSYRSVCPSRNTRRRISASPDRRSGATRSSR